MENALTILRQLIIMFIYMSCGYVLFRRQLITKEGNKTLAHLLLYLILPCVVIKSFIVQQEPGKSTELLISLAGAALVLGLAMLVSALIFRNRPIDNFGAAFSNAGFMGIPLITTVLSGEAVFYAAGMVALLNVLQWTYGQAVLTKDSSHYSLKAVIKSPLVISFVIGLVIFFVQIPIPDIISSSINSISALNAPVAMIVLGVYLGEMNILALFRDKHAYLATVARLLIIPLLTVVALMLIPSAYMDIRWALLIAASAPIGSNVAVYAQKQNQDYRYAVKTVCLSTVISILTMPLIMLVAQWLW